jgi:hypothetical protein
MTAEFPDTTLAEQAEREAQEADRVRRLAEEFDGVSLAELEEEIARRQAALDDLQDQHLQAQIRVVERRLLSLREEIVRREADHDDH